MSLGRPRRFCSATCRSAARRARSRPDHTACEIEFAGIRCGKPITASISIGERQLGACEGCAELLRSWLVQRGAQPTIATNNIVAVAAPAELALTDDAMNNAGVPSSGAVALIPARLSRREREVVVLFAKGHVADYVARELGLQVTTVQQYLARARLKYNAADRPAPTRIDLYRRAVEDGLLPPEDTTPPSPTTDTTPTARTSESSLSDQLVQRAIDGDSHATETLLRTLRPLVLRYCNARISDRFHVTADDIAQDVCLAVLTALPSYRAQGRPFLAFVYGIAAHKVADAHRNFARDRAEPVAALPDQVDLGRGPEEATMGILDTKTMSDLLARLPEKLREILLLRVVVGLSAVETAEAVGSTPGAVRIAQHRGLAQLRKMVIDQSWE